MNLEGLLVVYDTLEPCEFSSPDSCKKRFSWAHKEVDLAPHPVLVLQMGDAEKFPHAFDLESLDPFLRVSKRGPRLKVVERTGTTSHNRILYL